MINVINQQRNNDGQIESGFEKEAAYGDVAAAGGNMVVDELSIRVTHPAAIVTNLNAYEPQE